MKIPFAKMHGLGNDFLLIDARTLKLDNPATLARVYCERRFGIGADQLLLLLPARSDKAAVRMDIYNSDGGQVEMCGNGMRAFALFAAQQGAWDGQGPLPVETEGGIITPRVVSDGRVEVDMGTPRWDPRVIPVESADEVLDSTQRVGGGEWAITCVSMGNPHCVIFTDAVARVALDMVGPSIETDPFFPDRTNVEFVEVRAPDQLAVRVWERGSGATLACGTGACAALVAAARTGKSVRKAEVRLPGGALWVEWRDDDHVYQTGPAEWVFTGELDWPR